MAEINEKPERNVRRQQYLVKKFQLSYDEKPSAEDKLKLDMEKDKLQHLLNAEKGDVKNRAKAEFAGKAILSRVIQQAPQGDVQIEVWQKQKAGCKKYLQPAFC